jgi:tetratricopeptide (TPR) repeat protein/O-antigen ligase
MNQWSVHDMPKTRLEGFCDKVIEASWLAVLVVVPLFFNVYSSRVFEPDKITVLRSIAVVAAIAWAVKAAEGGLRIPHVEGGLSGVARAVWRQARETPLVLPTMALVIVYLLATATSIVPRVSLLGSYQRLQGTYSTLAYIVIFALILQGLRSREQVERLVTTVVLTSVPIALYGIVQHYGLDPLPWGGDVRARVAANMGNAIFVAAYLIMALPLALYRAVESFSVILTSEESRFIDILLGASYVFIVAIQGIAIFFTQSRGPWLGLIGGLFFFFLVLAVVRRWRWLVWGSVGVILGIAAFLVVFNLPQSPLAPLQSVPYVGRLGQVLDKEQTTSKVRVYIWEGAIDLILPHAPLERPDGTRDWLNPLRPLIGYGPESMYVAYNRFYPPGLAHYEARNASPDRSHNETFDALVTTGVVGFVAYMVLFASVVYFGFRWLGVIVGKAQRNLFLGCWIGGGVLGAVTMVLWQGAEFLGVGLPAGIAAGLGLYLIIWGLLLSPRTAGEAGTKSSPYSLLIVGLVAAILAHFVEIHFGISIAATRTYFWVYTGLMVVTGYVVPQEEGALLAASEVRDEGPQRERRKGRQRNSKRRQAVPAPSRLSGVRPVLPYALIVTLILCTLAYDFVSNNEARLHSPIAVVVASLAKRPQGGTLVPSYGILGVVGITWLLGSAIIVAEWLRKSGKGQWPVGLATCLAVPLAIGLIFALTMAMRLVSTVQQTQLLDQTKLVIGMLAAYYVVLFGLILALTSSLVPVALSASALWQPRRAWAYPFLAVGAVWAVLQTNVRVVEADMIYKQAQPYEQQGMWDYSIILHQEAIKRMPNEDYYDLFLGRAFLEKAKTALPADQAPQTYTMADVLHMTPEKLAGLSREDAMNCSEAALNRARQINPLNTDHSANLARLYRTRAEFSSDPAQRHEYLQDSLEYYAEATALSPHAAHLYDEWGIVYMAMDEPEEALAKYEHALILDDRYEVTYMSLGDLYMREDDLEKAKQAYLQAARIAPRSANVYSVLAYIYGTQEDYGSAIEETLKVLDLTTDDQQRYSSYKNLAIYYREVGQADDAIQAAQNALALAPAEERASLEALVTQLGGTPVEPQTETQLQQLLSEGQVALNNGEWEKAAQAYERVVTLDPRSIVAHSALSYVYAQQGKLEQAEAENLIVLEMVPTDLATLKNLAIIYRQMGQYDNALAYAQRALESPQAEASDKQQLEAFIEELRAMGGSG